MITNGGVVMDHGTLFIKGVNPIPADMVSTFQGVAYQGQQPRNMFDRRTNSFNEVQCHLFTTQFSDETKTVEIQVNPEFS